MPRGRTVDAHLFMAGMCTATALLFADIQTGPVDPLGWNNVALFALVSVSLTFTAVMRLPKRH